MSSLQRLARDLLAGVSERRWLAETLSEPLDLNALPTPALVLDADALDRNLARMSAFLAAHNKAPRPHAKTHKCPLIAKAQLAQGAVGVCAAKTGEAVALVAAGVDRVLVTSPVMDSLRAEILAALSRRARDRNPDARIDVVVDSMDGVDLLRQAVGSDDALGGVIDIDVGMGRTGTRERDEILALAESLSTTPGLRFAGVQHYAGQVMHLDGWATRCARSRELWETVGGHVGALRERGFEPEMVTGGGTGTFDIDCGEPLITDLQVGSYVFMDEQYRVIGSEHGEPFEPFDQSLTVVATVISQPRAGHVTVDAGFKAFAVDAGPPIPLTRELRYRFAGDEHGVLLAGDGAALPALGARVRFVPPHCDPTVNLYDAYWVVRDGLVRERWPIPARGLSW
ncbi:MAG: DSD1 family PLP-dependent enzyme [Pseudomonadales bacterium]